MTGLAFGDKHSNQVAVFVMDDATIGLLDTKYSWGVLVGI